MMICALQDPSVWIKFVPLMLRLRRRHLRGLRPLRGRLHHAECRYHHLRPLLHRRRRHVHVDPIKVVVNAGLKVRSYHRHPDTTKNIQLII
jgi:hypothetical protein